MCQRSEIFGVSSVGATITPSIGEKVAKCYRAMVILDSNYSYQHVLGESNLNASLVLVESYCVVFDIMIEDVDNVEFVDRPWGNNPKTVVAEFLTTD